MKNKLDSIDSVLKQEKLDSTQQQDIRNCLFNSKYSRLSYKSDHDLQKELSLVSLKQAVQEIVIQKQEAERKIIPINFDKENVMPLETHAEKEIKDLIQPCIESEKMESPSSMFLKYQDLSPEEKKYIESQEKRRLNILDQGKRKLIAEKLKSPKDKFELELDNFKKNQLLLRKSFESYNIKPERKSLTNREESLATKTIEEKIDTNLVKSRESNLKSIADTLKSMKQKYESSECKNLLDISFQENINNCIEDLEAIKTGKINRIALNQIEAKYTKIVEDWKTKIDEEIDRKKKAEEAEQLKKKLEMEEQIKKKKLLDDYSNLIQSFEKRFGEIKTTLKTQHSYFNQAEKDLVEIGHNQDLIDQINKNKKLIESIFNELNNELVKYFQISSNLSDKSIIDVNNILQELYNKYKKTVEILDKERLSLNVSIKEFNQKTQEMKAKEKAAAEKKKQEELKLKHEAELATKAAAEAKKKAEEEKLNKEKSITKSIDNDQNGINKITLQRYEKYREEFERIRKETDECFSEKSLKLYKYDLQKAINISLNSLLDDQTDETNRRIFIERINTLIKLFDGQTCAITTTLTVDPKKHPRAIEFCLVYLARKLIEKGEETVASRPETSFQYCFIITELLKRLTSFEPILIGQFQEKCPYVVPYYKPKLPSQTDVQYFESLGYKIIEGKIEEDFHYYRRMSGVLTLYFTLLMHSTSNSNMKSFDGPKMAWQWLSDVLNLTPRPNITAEMLCIFFKCCGYQMHKKYDKQFLKLVKICSTDYLKLIELIPSDLQSGASVGRLKSVFESFRKNNQFTDWKK